MPQHLARHLFAASVLAATAAVTTAAGATVGVQSPDTSATLAVCADPGNLPYSSSKLDGFENRVAALLAADMHRTLRYAWLRSGAIFSPARSWRVHAMS